MTAVALAALAVLLLAGSLVLDALTGQNLAENGGQDVIVFASAVTVGLVVAWHRPGNAIGWLLLAGVDVQGLAIAGSVYTTLARRPGYHLPVGPICGSAPPGSWGSPRSRWSSCCSRTERPRHGGGAG